MFFPGVGSKRNSVRARGVNSEALPMPRFPGGRRAFRQDKGQDKGVGSRFGHSARIDSRPLCPVPLAVGIVIDRDYLEIRFHVRWTNDIHEEWMRNVQSVTPFSRSCLIRQELE